MFNKLLKSQKARLQEDIESLEEEISIKQNELRNINSNILQARTKLSNYQDDLSSMTKDINEHKHDLGILEGLIETADLGIEYVPKYKSTNEIDDKKADITTDIADLIANDEAVLTTREYRIDGSSAKGRQFQKTFCENLMTGFTAYFNSKKKSITVKNFEKSRELVMKKFNTYNKKAAMMGVAISQQYLNACLTLMRLELDGKIAKAEEKEKIREEKRKLREQEKLLTDAEKAKAEIQKERRMYEQSLAKALNDQERQEFEEKLKEIDKREADVDYRVNNTRAGYLYITETKAMPNMTKIGVTRRLNPLVRIQELSSASTPYPFVCYGLVFDDNVFDLETKVHEYFDDKRVNTENRHKEFFYVTPAEAIEVLRNKFGCEVHFVNEEESEEE